MWPLITFEPLDVRTKRSCMFFATLINFCIFLRKKWKMENKIQRRQNKCNRKCKKMQLPTLHFLSCIFLQLATSHFLSWILSCRNLRHCIFKFACIWKAPPTRNMFMGWQTEKKTLPKNAVPRHGLEPASRIPGQGKKETPWLHFSNLFFLIQLYFDVVFFLYFYCMLNSSQVT